MLQKTNTCIMGTLKKVRAGSMIESLVAMTILVVIMLIAFSALSSINNYTKPAFKLDAFMECNLIVSDILLRELPSSDIEECLDTLVRGRNTIVKEITFYNENKQLLEVRLRALAPNGLVLCNRNLIVRKDED